ncbi:TPM domain-containing protein [Bifidobacterium pullorum subsp. saeculare]|uniref:TPM domain-containing protein n=1 Tax=Bifidobacterium pullorum TaxID=78448 RepID=UPI00195DFC42|nr:TPM domain-containing protein [Bifidobacterium pullorum]MBM6706225.1 TPM domain-containing protein [Bifidobacterium pullorum subsp. saeculare]
MSESNNADGKTGIVVERLTARRLSAAVSNPCKWLVSALAATLALIMWITPVGLADETGEDTDPDLDGGALTSSITDTENLLGSNVTEVTDAIDQLHEQTGVSVRLLYLSSFSAGEGQVNQWASDVLESTDPEPNTVLLAVASHDGNLVVAVSANSDEWLHRQSTVDELSQAALDPLVENDTPDWSASALGMIEQINVVYRTATSPSVIVIGAAALGGVVVILAIVVVVMLVRRRRRRQPSDETEPAETTETVAEDTGLSEEEAEPTEEMTEPDESEPAEEPEPASRKSRWPLRRKPRGRHSA